MNGLVKKSKRGSHCRSTICDDARGGVRSNSRIVGCRGFSGSGFLLVTTDAEVHAVNVRSNGSSVPYRMCGGSD